MATIHPQNINRHRSFQIINDTTTYYIQTSQNTIDDNNLTYLNFDSSSVNVFDLLDIVDILNIPYVKKDTTTYLTITNNPFILPEFYDSTTFYIDSTTIFQDSSTYVRNM